MDFDITKLCYKQGDNLSYEPTEGSEGYFTDSLEDMYNVVTHHKVAYYGKLIEIKKENERAVYAYPFINQGGIHYAYFYPIEKGTLYRPYTWEDTPSLMCRIYVNKSFRMKARANSFTEKDGQLCIDGIEAFTFLSEYEWEDGTPCGVLIGEDCKEE